MSGARFRTVAGPVLLLVFGCLAGALASEIAYRTYLYFAWASAFRPVSDKGYFSAYSVSHWEFDRQFGYVYPPGRVIDYTGVQDGYVQGCDRINMINKYGNIGPIKGNYSHADVRILVFGDSWTAFHQQGKTWPNVLQEALERRLGRSVHVVNFGRDGYGILQMFDLAAARIPEWKPDLVIFAFITDDLTRARFWRTVVGEGDDVRVLTTVDPVRHPDPERSADTFLILPSATHEWCRSMAGSKRTDGVLKKLRDKHQELLASWRDTTRANVFTLRHSYLYNRVTRGDAFWFLPSPVNPRVRFSDFSADQRFVASVERVDATRTPWVVFHLAYYPEIKAGREAILNGQEAALWDSLERIGGKRILRTTDYVPMPVAGPERMNSSPDNFHPSVWGMEFYADAVATGLSQHGLIGRGLRRGAPGPSEPSGRRR